jgi:hypothetical protein
LLDIFWAWVGEDHFDDDFSVTVFSAKVERENLSFRPLSRKLFQAASDGVPCICPDLL